MSASCRRATLFGDPHHEDGHIITEVVLLEFAHGVLWEVCDGLGVEASAGMKEGFKPLLSKESAVWAASLVAAQNLGDDPKLSASLRVLQTKRRVCRVDPTRLELVTSAMRSQYASLLDITALAKPLQITELTV